MIKITKEYLDKKYTEISEREDLAVAYATLLDDLYEKIRESEIKDSFILNTMDNWNYLRDVLSNVQDIENDEFENCDRGDFVEIKKFSEGYAMNTFRGWFSKINKEYEIKNLDEHESFKSIFWKSIANAR